jgi:hypothetical protein
MATTRLIIELEASSLPRGQVVPTGGEPIAFTGWVELTAALEQARGAAAPAGTLPATSALD